MRRMLFNGLRLGVLFVIILLCPTLCWSFYSQSTDNYDLNLGGSFAVGLGVAQYPDFEFLNENDNEASWCVPGPPRGFVVIFHGAHGHRVSSRSV